MNLLSKKRIKKERKRFKIAIVFLFVLIFAAVLGVAKNIDWSEVITPFTPIKLIRPIPEKGIEAELKEDLQKMDIEVFDGPKLLGKDLEASISGGIIVLFTTQKDFKDQIASLQLMIERFKIEGKLPKKVDLRFEKTVVTF